MNWKKIFIAIIIISFIASGYIAFQRYQVENFERAYEITMPYEEVVKMASFNGRTLADSLANWKSVGVNSITLTEMTIHSLKDNGRFNLHSHFEGNNLILEGDRVGLELIAERLSNRLAVDRQISFNAAGGLVIEGNVNDFFKTSTLAKYGLDSEQTRILGRAASIVEFIGLGFLDEDIELIKQSGMALRLRPAYVYWLQDAKYSIDQTLNYIDRYSQQPYICFSGNDVLGTDSELDYLAAQLKARNIAVVMIETPVQRQFVEQTGLPALVEKMDYQAVRALSTFDFIRDRYDYQIPFHHRGEEVANTYFRAITERNISVVFFKTYTRSGRLLDVPSEHYKMNLAVLKQRLAAHGIANISADWNTATDNFYMVGYHVDHRLVGIVALGVVAALFLLINLFYQLPNSINLLFSILATLAVGSVYILNIKVASFNLLFGLLATMVFALLSVYYIVWQARRLYDLEQPLTFGKVFLRGATVLLTAILLSLVGAAFEISFYADSKFLLEMAIFRGVKVSQLVPLMVAFLIAVYYFGKEILGKVDLTRSQQLKYVLDLNVKIWQVLVAFALLLLVALLLLRSGHEKSIGTPSIELFFRNTLEYFLYARPRNKALILGFPIVIIFMHVVNGKKHAWSYPVFAFLAAIGQVDILNTFSHLRTPLDLSIIRVFLAFLLSLVVYAIYMVGFMICVHLLKWFKQKLNRQCG